LEALDSVKDNLSFPGNVGADDLLSKLLQIEFDIRDSLFQGLCSSGICWFLSELLYCREVDSLLAKSPVARTQRAFLGMIAQVTEIEGQSNVRFCPNRSRWSQLPTIFFLVACPYPSLPVASFGAPLSCLPPHPRHQGSRRSERIVELPWRYNRWARIDLDDLSSVAFRSPRSRQVSQNRCHPSAR